MAYYLDLFSPETYEAFSRSSRDVSGFRLRHEGLATRVQIGDKFICYMTKLSRWFGLLQVTSKYFKDDRSSMPGCLSFLFHFSILETSYQDERPPRLVPAEWW